MAFTPAQILTAAGGLDAGALAFIAAAGLTDAAQKNALNRLVIDLKTYGIWTKLKACYPFVGGTAAAHKYNLKDARDLDAAFRLVFAGGWTHSATGALPDGSTAYADTKFIPNDQFIDDNSAHLAVYSRTDTAAGNKQEIGAGAVNEGEAAMLIKYSGDVFYPIWASWGNTYPSVASTDSRGLFILNRQTSGTIEAWRNGSQLSLSLSGAQTGGRALRNLYLGAQNAAGTAARFSDREIAFAAIGNGLTSTESGNFYSIVQRFQTALGRNV